MKTPKAPVAMVQPFATEHLKQLLFLCDDSTFLGARNKAFILVDLDTMLRLSEIASIKLSDVDMAQELVRVMGKGGKERWVRIGRRAQRALLKYIHFRHDSQPWLWLSEERTPISAGGLYQALHQLGHRAGITDIRVNPHRLRHTGATLALKNGGTERQVQEILGHSTQAMTKRYTRSLESKWAAEGHRKFSPVDNLNL